MQPEPAGAASAAPESPPADPSFAEQVLAALERFSTRLDALENSGPRFVPASVETYGAAEDRRNIANQSPADGVPRSQTVPIFTNGEKVPDLMQRQYPARFGPGSRVKLNPDAVPHGHTDGKTRGELKAVDGSPWGEGEVIDRKFLTNQGTWKYKVRFRNARVITGASGGTTMFHEPELIPA